MTELRSLPRRIAVALMEHAARALPAAREPWAIAMQNELAQIENDLEAVTWAAGCVAASYVERGRAMTRRQTIIGLAAVIAIATIGAASWWEGQRPYLTPGNHQVFREGSSAGAVVGFLVFIAAAIPGMAALFTLPGGLRKAARAGRICALILAPYTAAVVLVSLLTPRTVVSIGDSYCYDLWCFGVNQVSATPHGQDVLYDVRVTAFVDSTEAHRLPAEGAKRFFYVVDDQGRRYSLLPQASFADADVTVNPGESVHSSFAFLTPANAQKLYLMGNDYGWLPWVYLYFGSDFSLFHRAPLLRIV